MTNDLLAESLIPLAAELIGTVRDFGPDDVAAVLARVPDGRHDALAVVLAAMVDPDARVGELLAWTTAGPVQSRGELPPRENWGGRTPAPREHGTEKGYQQHRHRRELPACQPCRKAHSQHTRKASASAVGFPQALGPVLDSDTKQAV